MVMVKTNKNPVRTIPMGPLGDIRTTNMMVNGKIMTEKFSVVPTFHNCWQFSLVMSHESQRMLVIKLTGSGHSFRPANLAQDPIENTQDHTHTHIKFSSDYETFLRKHPRCRAHVPTRTIPTRTIFSLGFARRIRSCCIFHGRRTIHTRTTFSLRHRRTLRKVRCYRSSPF